MNRSTGMLDLNTVQETPTTYYAPVSNLAYIGRKPGSPRRDSDAWFTPATYIESVKAALGRIDLDPFSSAQANRTVGARQFFSIEKSAFEHEWDIQDHCRVFMNPPYSAGLCARAIARFVQQWEIGNFVEGIVLVNNATDTKWFKALAEKSTSLCFTDHRISFWNADKKNISGNTRGQVFAYFGQNSERFKAAFQQHGLVMAVQA